MSKEAGLSNQDKVFMNFIFVEIMKMKAPYPELIKEKIEEPEQLDLWGNSL
jgi:hypothetical protein